jgi:hypothetical protein
MIDVEHNEGKGIPVPAMAIHFLLKALFQMTAAVYLGEDIVVRVKLEFPKMTDVFEHKGQVAHG